MKHKLKLFTALLILVAMLAPTAALAANQAVITGDMVNFRSGPAVTSSRLAYLYKGDKIEVGALSNGWYSASYNGQSGYVYSQYVKQSASVQTSSALLKRGSTGERVRILQDGLIYLGYLKGSADGVFGSKTYAAVRSYQSANGLSADGVVGAITDSCLSAERSRVESIVSLAKRFLGLPYVYGGTTTAGFDCSGYTQYVYKNAVGVSIPRVSRDQATAGKRVTSAKLRAGDLVAFNSPVSHVGIYLGDGKFIHSPKTGDVVKITYLSAMDLTAIRRFTGPVQP